MTGTNCTLTYAEAIGNEFSFYHGLYLGVALMTFLYSLVQTGRIWLFTSLHSFQFQKLVNCLALLATVFLVVQASDPGGYTNTIDRLSEVLISDFTATICLIILFVFIMQFCALTSQQWTQGSTLTTGSAPIWERYFWGTAIGAALFLAILFGCLEVYLERDLFRGVKLILYALVILVTTGRANWLLWRARNRSIQNNVYPVRLYIYSALFNLFVLVVVVYQMVVGGMSIWTASHPREPIITSDMVVFPLLEATGLLLTVAYTSKVQFSDTDNPFHQITAGCCLRDQMLQL